MLGFGDADSNVQTFTVGKLVLFIARRGMVSVNTASLVKSIACWFLTTQ